MTDYWWSGVSWLVGNFGFAVFWLLNGVYWVAAIHLISCSACAFKLGYIFDQERRP